MSKDIPSFKEEKKAVQFKTVDNNPPKFKPTDKKKAQFKATDEKPPKFKPADKKKAQFKAVK